MGENIDWLQEAKNNMGAATEDYEMDSGDPIWWAQCAQTCALIAIAEWLARQERAQAVASEAARKAF